MQLTYLALLFALAGKVDVVCLPVELGVTNFVSSNFLSLVFGIL